VGIDGGRGQATRLTESSVTWWLVAAASVGAGIVHAAVGFGHPAGAHRWFFVTVAAFQVWWGSLVWPDGPSDRSTTLGVGVLSGVLVLYLATHSVGLPVGERIPVERAGVAAAALETVVLAFVSMGRHRPVSWGRWSVPALTVVILVVAAVGVWSGLEGGGHVGADGLHVH